MGFETTSKETVVLLTHNVRNGEHPNVWQAVVYCPVSVFARKFGITDEMPKHILISGGAGFIGSHVANELLEHGYRVRVLDSLVPQVHGPDRRRPDYLSNEVELVVGDIRE